MAVISLGVVVHGELSGIWMKEKCWLLYSDEFELYLIVRKLPGLFE